MSREMQDAILDAQMRNQWIQQMQFQQLQMRMYAQAQGLRMLSPTPPGQMLPMVPHPCAVPAEPLVPHPPAAMQKISLEFNPGQTLTYDIPVSFSPFDVVVPWEKLTSDSTSRRECDTPGTSTTIPARVKPPDTPKSMTSTTIAEALEQLFQTATGTTNTDSPTSEEPVEPEVKPHIPESCCLSECQDCMETDLLEDLRILGCPQDLKSPFER